jgi:hypothetical protein
MHTAGLDEAAEEPVAAGGRLDPHLNDLEQNSRPHGMEAMAGHKGGGRKPAAT